VGRKNKTIMELRIRYDENAESRREDTDNLGTMACWHNRYELGDTQPSEQPSDWFKDNVTAGCIALRLYLYDHSGIQISTEPFNCRWDSGQIGWIFVTPAKLKKELGDSVDHGKVEDMLRDEVKVYDLCQRGQCWGYEYGEDSCWGFVGEDLKETGLMDHIPREAHHLVEAAWEARK